MHRRLRISLAPALALSLVFAACGSDENSGEDDGPGEDGSIESLLDEIPASAAKDPDNILIVTGDLDRAAELADRPRPAANAPTDDLLDWITPLTGVGRDGVTDTVHVLLPQSAAYIQLNQNDAIRDELGWSLAEVSSFVELQVPPDQFAVIRADVGEDDLDAAIGDPVDGIWSLGGDDYAVSLDDVTPARRLGESVRMALDDDLLVVSRSTPPVRAWLDGDSATLADDDALAAVAGALDDADVYSSMLFVNEFSVAAALGVRATPEQIEAITERTDLIPVFDALGAGLSVVDGEAIGSLVYHFGSESAAESAVDAVRDVFENGNSLIENKPLSDRFALRDVQVDGSVVVASFAFTDTLPGTIWNMVLQRDLPTTHR